MGGDPNRRESLGRMAQRRAAQPFTPYGAAAKEYPFLRNHDVEYSVTPREGHGFAETWPAGEPGAPDMPRPKQFPMDRPGVQVFKPKQFGNADIAGEVLHFDPVALRTQEQFAKTISPAQREELQQQPDYQMGDGSPEQKENSAIAAAIRGYAVKQWPQKDIDRFFRPEQRQMLDGLKSYMATGRE